MWTATARAQHMRDGLRFASNPTDAATACSVPRSQSRPATPPQQAICPSVAIPSTGGRVRVIDLHPSVQPLYYRRPNLGKASGLTRLALTADGWSRPAAGRMCAASSSTCMRRASRRSPPRRCGASRHSMRSRTTYAAVRWMSACGCARNGRHRYLARCALGWTTPSAAPPDVVILPPRSATQSRARSDTGGMGAAAIASLIAAARLNGLDPDAHRRHVLERIVEHPRQQVAELLPWHCAHLTSSARADRLAF